MVQRAPLPGQSLGEIQIMKGIHNKAFYQGLMSCGGIWTCPVCAAKISERRRQELKQAIEAAQALGLSRWRRWRRIVLPQAMRSIVPPAGNMLIGTLKGTSIVSVIAVNDLLFSAQLIYHRTYQVIPLLMVATLWYAVVTTVLGIGQAYVEKYYARGTGGTR